MLVNVNVFSAERNKTTRTTSLKGTPSATSCVWKVAKPLHFNRLRRVPRGVTAPEYGLDGLVSSS